MRFLNTREVAVLTGFSEVKLKLDRQNSTGLPYYKIGKSVRYSETEVREYMDKFRVVPDRKQKVVIKRRSGR